MARGLYMKIPFYCLVFFITSCVTINIYFPAAAVEKAADRIVDEVWGADEGKEPAEKEPRKEGSAPQSLLENAVMLAVLVTGPGEAYAQEADINVTTPAIRTLKESIKKRAETIKPFMDSGNVGIGNDGLLVIRNSAGLKLKDKARLKRLIEAENRDRNSLYSEIAKANGFPPEKVAEIKRIFAGSWIKKARKGWWVQGPDGTWKRK